jgi:type II secretory pathway component GspD/PulD (secretin)
VTRAIRGILGLAMTAILLVASSGLARGAERGPSKATTGCTRPSPKLKIKVNLKPDTEVVDLLAWYSTLTCTPLMVSSGVTIAGKKVTIISPTPVTVAEIDSLFRGALDSVGLTLQRDGKFFYVIDAAKARHSNTPIIPARQ